MTKTIFYFVAALLLMTSCQKQEIASWAAWRGPNGDGISNDSLWKWNQLDSAHILWQTNIGFGHSSVSVVGNHCLAAGWSEELHEKDTVRNTTVFCLDTQTGHQIWSFKFSADKRSYPGPRSTPVVDGDRVFFLGSEGKLFCLNLKNGEEEWQLNLAKDSLSIIDQWGYCPSPVIHNNLILLNLNRNGMAINKKNGKIEWNSPKMLANFASAKIIEYQGKEAAVFAADSTLNIVEITTGKVLNRYKKEKIYTMHNDVMPLPNNQWFTSDELLSLKGGQIERVWKNDTISSFFQTGVVIDGYAYQLSTFRNKGFLYCIDLKTGVPTWREDLGRWGTLLGTKDKLILLTGTGKVIVADANSQQFTPIKSLQVLPSEDIEANWCWTMPTLFDGQLYVHNSKGDLACINLK